MLERGGGQQFQADVVGEHVGEGQAQLGIAVQCCLGTRDLAAIKFQVAAAFVGGNGDGAGTDDDITRLVGVGDRGGKGQGREGGTEQGLVHGSSQRT
ncbi:hypothetical protein D3C76_1695670 [compost metagenome]